MNLLHETIDAILNSGHDKSQIIFVGSEKSGHCCTWDEFEKLADREYNESYGSPEVADDLIIVFGDGAKMLRGEKDGSEWWDFSTPFKMPEELKPIIASHQRFD